MLSSEERARYARQTILPDFGIEGQATLKSTSVLVIGAGGLGCPVLTYLVAAGIGHVGMVDDDVVSVSNLHRQTLFAEADAGRLKVEVAKERLQRQNPHVKLSTYAVKITSNNALELIETFDIVVDGSDNFPTRYLVNDACILLNKPLVFGAIHQYEGQVSVFNYKDEHGNTGPNYRDLFPAPPPPGQIPNCAEAGVFGVLAGIIGSLQVNETLKIALKKSDVLSGKLLLFDSRDASTMTINIKKTFDQSSIKSLIDYDIFCGIVSEGVEVISWNEVIDLQGRGMKLDIVDVREKNEIDLDDKGFNNIPLSELESRLAEISDDVIFVCRSGQRSMKAVQVTMEHKKAGRYRSLSGGVNQMK